MASSIGEISKNITKNHLASKINVIPDNTACQSDLGTSISNKINVDDVSIQIVEPTRYYPIITCSTTISHKPKTITALNPITDAIALILIFIAIEELSFADIINDEGEKIQTIVAALKNKEVDIATLLDVNNSVSKTLEKIIKQQISL